MLYCDVTLITDFPRRMLNIGEYLMEKYITSFNMVKIVQYIYIYSTYANTSLLYWHIKIIFNMYVVRYFGYLYFGGILFLIRLLIHHYHSEWQICEISNSNNVINLIDTFLCVFISRVNKIWPLLFLYILQLRSNNCQKIFM